MTFNNNDARLIKGQKRGDNLLYLLARRCLYRFEIKEEPLKPDYMMIVEKKSLSAKTDTKWKNVDFEIVEGHAIIM